MSTQVSAATIFTNASSQRFAVERRRRFDDLVAEFGEQRRGRLDAGDAIGMNASVSIGATVKAMRSRPGGAPTSSR